MTDQVNKCECGVCALYDTILQKMGPYDDPESLSDEERLELVLIWTAHHVDECPDCKQALEAHIGVVAAALSEQFNEQGIVMLIW